MIFVDRVRAEALKPFCCAGLLADSGGARADGPLFEIVLAATAEEAKGRFEGEWGAAATLTLGIDDLPDLFDRMDKAAGAPARRSLWSRCRAGSARRAAQAGLAGFLVHGHRHDGLPQRFVVAARRQSGACLTAAMEQPGFEPVSSLSLPQLRAIERRMRAAMDGAAACDSDILAANGLREASQQCADEAANEATAGMAERHARFGGPLSAFIAQELKCRGPLVR